MTSDPKAVKRSRRPQAKVVAIPGADRPQDALKRIHEALANEKPRGIIVATVTDDGGVDVRVYGEFKRQEVLWAGTLLSQEATA